MHLYCIKVNVMRMREITNSRHWKGVMGLIH